MTPDEGADDYKPNNPSWMRAFNGEQSPIMHPGWYLKAYKYAGLTITAYLTYNDSLDNIPVGGTIDWGDGTPNTVIGTTHNSAQRQHTYAEGGNYLIGFTPTDGDPVGSAFNTSTMPDLPMELGGLEGEPPVGYALQAFKRPSAGANAVYIVIFDADTGFTLQEGGSIDWGNGTLGGAITIGAPIPAERTYVYASPGTYTVSFVGAGEDPLGKYGEVTFTIPGLSALPQQLDPDA